MFPLFSHLGGEELFGKRRSSDFSNKHQNCVQNHGDEAFLRINVKFLTSYHHTEAEGAHNNQPDVYGSVLDKLYADPLEEEDVLAEPWVTAKLVKELVIAEREQVGDDLPDHLLLGGGGAPDEKEEESRRGEERELQPAFQLEQPGVGGGEELEELNRGKDDQKE